MMLIIISSYTKIFTSTVFNLFSHIVESCYVVLESSGIFVNHSHMTLMIKWILMFLSARMEIVMTGVCNITDE